MTITIPGATYTPTRSAKKMPVKFNPDSNEYLTEHKIGDVRIDMMNLWNMNVDPNFVRNEVREVISSIGFLDYRLRTFKCTTDLETLAEVFDWKVVRQNNGSSLYVAKGSPIIPATIRDVIQYVALSKTQ